MHRRELLQASAAAAGLLVCGRRGGAEPIARLNLVPVRVPAVLAEYTAADQRARLRNIGTCQRAIRSCLRKHSITNYLPGQCCYNLGEYPCRKPWEPDAWDEQELDRLRDHGIRLIQVHEEWNDSQRLFGSHKLAALNPAGFHRFVEMVFLGSIIRPRNDVSGPATAARSGSITRRIRTVRTATAGGTRRRAGRRPSPRTPAG